MEQMHITDKWLDKKLVPIDGKYEKVKADITIRFHYNIK